eukprot:7708079-Pyramimonas_sp.AAC.1
MDSAWRLEQPARGLEEEPMAKAARRLVAAAVQRRDDLQPGQRHAHRLRHRAVRPARLPQAWGCLRGAVEDPRRPRLVDLRRQGQL